MTIEEMKDYFSHRELGLQEAAGEYAILGPPGPVGGAALPAL